MGRISWGLYRLKWAVGYRLIGPDSWTRKIKARFHYEKWLIYHVKGWFGFLLWRLGVRIHFRATVDGVEYNIRSRAERDELSKQVRRVYQPSPFEEEVLGKQAGVFRFNFGGKALAFPYDGDRYGTMVVLKQFFIDEPYAGLDVAGRDVVDIGSSIGDTPIYFVLKGARRVLAFEPYPATFERAKENVSLNGFEDKVVLLNEGAGASGWMRLTRAQTNLWANAVPSKDGQDVRFSSLSEIITRFGIQTAVLKFHGEGSEYDFFENASKDDLAHFTQIAMKYHYGAKPILKKLKSAGFEITKKWDLHFSYNSSSSSPKYEAGMILARLVRPRSD